jgi:hypothetical protein
MTDIDIGALFTSTSISFSNDAMDALGHSARSLEGNGCFRQHYADIDLDRKMRPCNMPIDPNYYISNVKERFSNTIS